MENNIETSVETMDVAEPSTEVESEERVEVADPLDNGTPSEPNEAIDEEADTHVENSINDSGRTESDAAFAEMRRKNEGLERDVQMLQEALGRYFDGETPEELALMAQAYQEEREYDDVKADHDKEKELEDLREKVRLAEEEKMNLEIDQLIAQGLRDVQEIDPTIKSLEELDNLTDEEMDANWDKVKKSLARL